MKVFVFNGWAAGERAWELCRFHRDRIFSYRELLSGEAERAVAECDGCLIVGWSMGGSFALRAVLRFPEKIKAMVLLAGTPRMMADGPDWPGFTTRKLMAFKKGLKYSLAGMSFGLPAGVPNPYEDDSEANLNAGLAYLEKVDIRSELESARPGLPVRIFHSERDAIVKLNTSRFLLRVFERSCLQVIPGGEHALPVVIPDQIDAAVTELILESRGQA